MDNLLLAERLDLTRQLSYRRSKPFPVFSLKACSQCSALSCWHCSGRHHGAALCCCMCIHPNRVHCFAWGCQQGSQIIEAIKHCSGACSFIWGAEEQSGFGKPASLKMWTPPSTRSSACLRASLAAVAPRPLQALLPWLARQSSPSLHDASGQSPPATCS